MPPNIDRGAGGIWKAVVGPRAVDPRLQGFRRIHSGRIAIQAVVA